MNAINAALNVYLPIIPIIYPQTLVDLVCENKHEKDKLLASVNIPRRLMRDPQAQISLLQFRHLVEAVMKQSKSLSLGIDFGMALDLKKHGLLGYAMTRNLMSMESIRLIVEYFKIRMPIIGFSIEFNGGRAEINFEAAVELGSAHQWILEAVVGSFYVMYHDHVDEIQIILNHQSPADSAPYRQLKNADVYFDGRFNQFSFRCARLVNTESGSEAPLSSVQENHARDIYMVEQIKKVLADSSDANLSQEHVAMVLGYSSRTCRRLLQNSGYSFSEIKDEVLKHKALTYLRGTNHSVDCIAKLLGYSDKANFRRAFKRWTGRSPSTFR